MPGSTGTRSGEPGSLFVDDFKLCGKPFCQLVGSGLVKRKTVVLKVTERFLFSVGGIWMAGMKLFGDFLKE